MSYKVYVQRNVEMVHAEQFDGCHLPWILAGSPQNQTFYINAGGELRLKIEDGSDMQCIARKGDWIVRDYPEPSNRSRIRVMDHQTFSELYMEKE